MVASIDNLQQHLIDKLQEQATQSDDVREEANPADVQAYQEQMNAPATNNSQVDGSQNTVSSATNVDSSQTQSPGDKVLDMLGSVDDNLATVANQPLENLSGSDALKMQIEVAKTSTEESVATAVSSKTSKDFDTLLKS